jgi:hypothetical protein
MSKLVATLLVVVSTLMMTPLHGAKVNWNAKGKAQFDKKPTGGSCNKGCSEHKSLKDLDDNNTKSKQNSLDLDGFLPLEEDN